MVTTYSTANIEWTGDCMHMDSCIYSWLHDACVTWTCSTYFEYTFAKWFHRISGMSYILSCTTWVWTFTVLTFAVCALCLVVPVYRAVLAAAGQSLEFSVVLVLNQSFSNCAKLILHIALPSFSELPLRQNKAHGHICIVQLWSCKTVLAANTYNYVGMHNNFISPLKFQVNKYQHHYFIFNYVTLSNVILLNGCSSTPYLCTHKPSLATVLNGLSDV